MKKVYGLCFLLFMMAGQNVFGQFAKFNLDTPPGWTRTDTVRPSSGNMLVKLLSPIDIPEEGKHEIMQLLIQKSSPNMALLKGYLKEGTEVFKENGSGQVTVDGATADWFEITLRRKAATTVFTERYHHLAKNGLSYMFICIVPNEDFSILQPKVDALLTSFKVLE